MMSEVLGEWFKSVLLACTKTERWYCMPSLKHLDHLLLARSLGIV